MTVPRRMVPCAQAEARALGLDLPHAASVGKRPCYIQLQCFAGSTDPATLQALQRPAGPDGVPDDARVQLFQAGMGKGGA